MESLIMYFRYPFVQYALIVGTLIALCSSLFGVTLVLKRFSLLGDGLSHVAFGASAVASVVGLVSNSMLITMPVTVGAAICLLCGRSKKSSNDASVAMISISSLALGYLIINIFANSANLSGDVCSTLFGSTSILTLSITDVIVSVIVALVVVLAFILFYNKIFALTFDEDFARATGVNCNYYNTAIAVVIAVVIVLAMNLVGSLLVSALIVFPALTAMRLFDNFKAVTICSAIVSVLCAVTGMIVSILYGTPVGSTIVAVDLLLFIVSCVIGRLRGNV